MVGELNDVNPGRSLRDRGAAYPMSVYAAIASVACQQLNNRVLQNAEVQLQDLYNQILRLLASGVDSCQRYFLPGVCEEWNACSAKPGLKVHVRGERGCHFQLVCKEVMSYDDAEIAAEQSELAAVLQMNSLRDEASSWILTADAEKRRQAGEASQADLDEIRKLELQGEVALAKVQNAADPDGYSVVMAETGTGDRGVSETYSIPEATLEPLCHAFVSQAVDRSRQITLADVTGSLTKQDVSILEWRQRVPVCYRIRVKILSHDPELNLHPDWINSPEAGPLSRTPSSSSSLSVLSLSPVDDDEVQEPSFASSVESDAATLLRCIRLYWQQQEQLTGGSPDVGGLIQFVRPLIEQQERWQRPPKEDQQVEAGGPQSSSSFSLLILSQADTKDMASKILRNHSEPNVRRVISKLKHGCNPTTHTKLSRGLLDALQASPGEVWSEDALEAFIDSQELREFSQEPSLPDYVRSLAGQPKGQLVVTADGRICIGGVIVASSGCDAKDPLAWQTFYAAGVLLHTKRKHGHLPWMLIEASSTGMRIYFPSPDHSTWCSLKLSRNLNKD